MRFTIYSMILSFLFLVVACSPSTTVEGELIKKDNSSHNKDSLVPQIEKGEVGPLFNQLDEYEGLSEGDLPAQFKTSFVKEFYIDAEALHKYKVYPIGLTKKLVLITTNFFVGEAATESDYLLALYDSNKGLVDSAHVHIVSKPMGADDWKTETFALGTNLIVIDYATPEYKDNPEFVRGIELVKNIPHQDVFWVEGSTVHNLALSNKATMQKARNWIYAKHGYKFKNKDLADYFGKFDWYQPKLDNVEELMSKQEKDVVFNLKKMELTL